MDRPGNQRQPCRSRTRASPPTTLRLVVAKHALEVLRLALKLALVLAGAYGVVSVGSP